MLNKLYHVQITFSHSIVLTMEQQREHVITQYRTHRKIAITSLKACYLLTRTGFPSCFLSLFLLKIHPCTDKLMALLFGSNEGFWFATACKYRHHFLMVITQSVQVWWEFLWWRDEALVELSTQPLWLRPLENTQSSSNILSEKGWIDKASVMVPDKRDNYLQPPDRQQQ